MEQICSPDMTFIFRKPCGTLGVQHMWVTVSTLGVSVVRYTTPSVVLKVDTRKSQHTSE